MKLKQVWLKWHELASLQLDSVFKEQVGGPNLTTQDRHSVQIRKYVIDRFSFGCARSHVAEADEYKVGLPPDIPSSEVKLEVSDYSRRASLIVLEQSAEPFASPQVAKCKIL